jgi:hypothetical protein
MGARAVRDFEGISIDESDWPIILTVFPRGRVSDSALHDVLGHLEHLMHVSKQRGAKLFFITDLTHMHEVTPASQRRYTAEWMGRTSQLQRAASVGGAQVTPSAVLRGIITAVFWLQPPPIPPILVATREEALQKGIELLEAAGIAPPARLSNMRRSGLRSRSRTP